MALVTSFNEYLCSCGEYLFRHSDITASNMLGDTNYLFVSENVTNSHGKNKIVRVGNSKAKCRKCANFVGGFVFNETTTEIRFVRHQIIRQIKSIYIYSVIDEKGKILKNQYELREICSTPILIRLGTLQRE